MDEGKIIEQVLKEVSRRSLFGVHYVDIGDNFVIKVDRDWTEPNEDITDKIRLTLRFQGPTTGDNNILSLFCDGMLEVMANTSKLIEDRKRLKWNARKEKWTF